MKLQLPNSVCTKQDVQSLILDVKNYSSWFSHNAIKKHFRVKRKTKQEPEISEATVELLRDWNSQKPVSRRSLDELITALETFLSTAPQITITLSAPPTDKVKKTLVSWCRENVAPNSLLVFQFDTSLLGGMIIRYGSRLFDWSFRRQIMAARDKFPEILRNV